MMQGEKVAADIRDAHESLARRCRDPADADADLAPPATAAAAGARTHRAQREGARRGDGGAGGGDADRSRRRCAACDFDPARTRALRGAAVRAARHGAQICRQRWKRCPRSREKYAGELRDLAKLRPGSRPGAAKSRPRPTMPPRAAELSGARKARARRLRRGQRRTAAAEAGARAILRAGHVTDEAVSADG